ncbi:MAG: BMC domain-containing protein [Caloramator sp.]|nr:BMC domain-containing protein [Caloramator sp.]
MREAIGIVETRGLVAAIQAADTMVKTANVKIMNYQIVGSGLVSVTVSGEVAAVKAAVENGRRVAEEISEVISFNVIPRPHDEVDRMF